jgi:D-beta-D-heptose 7-phosphate kinase/D-beta-D-heptose 1-phosphate adenosyltransferase
MTELKNSQPQKRFKILLLGDVCIDEYQYGHVDRLSPEAPVPVFRHEYSESKPGMAANVAANLDKLGCDVRIISGELSHKTRIIDLRSKQHIVRIDKDNRSKPLPQVEEDLRQYDAIVISDYDKGLISSELIRDLIYEFDGPIFIDTKKQELSRFVGRECFLKINEVEFNRLRSGTPNMIVTLGSKGAMYGGEIYPAPNVEVVDVCGAGDTFLAALAYFYLLESKNVENAIKKAILASSVTVQHTGVYAPSLDEICD